MLHLWDQNLTVTLQQMPRITSSDLLFVSKARKEKLDSLSSGVSLVARTGYDLERIRIKAALDRIEFARTILKCAEEALRVNPPMCRTATSRGYYSMYHALRAVTFFVSGGDDHEKHVDLPSQLPRDFPDRATWENCLKTARLERNKADYDPYPKKDKQFATCSQQILQDARTLMPIVRKYIRQKGCF